MAEISATSLNLVAENDESEQELITAALHSGSREKYKKRWIEFDCQKGVHHGKWSTYKDGKRIRVEGGYIGRFNLVAAVGEYGKRRVEEFKKIHVNNCHYVERFSQDLEECGISGIAVEGWHSGRGAGGLYDGEGNSGEAGNDVHRA